MTTVQELNLYALGVAAQASQGTPKTPPVKRLVQVGGDFNAPRDEGTENFSDLEKYGDNTDWINNLVGNGTPQIESTPDELAYLLWLLHGAETVTSVTGPPAKKDHEFVPGWTYKWATFFKRVGQEVVQRHRYNDCRLSQLQLEGSTGAKVVRATSTVISLDPAQFLAADPVLPAMPTLTKTPFLYTDGKASFTIDGTVIRGHSGFSVVINEDLQPIYGDDITPIALRYGNPSVAITASLYMDADGLAQWNKLLYGDPTPADLDKPQALVPPVGDYSFLLQARDSTGALTGDEFELAIPGVKWNLPDSPGPAPDGSNAELQLVGGMRKVSGKPGYTINVRCDDAAYV